MIEWLRRHSAQTTFLISGEQSWTYGEALAEVESRLADDWVEVTPRLDPDSVFAILAGLSGGGLTVRPSKRGMEDGVWSTEAVARRASDSLLTVFTSGTTGHSRGVRLTLANLEAAARGSMEHLGHGRDDVWLLCLPLHHVGGLSVLVRSAYAGGAVLITPGFEPATAAAAMRGPVTVVSMVPTMLVRTLDHDPGPYVGLRAVVLGGGPVPDGFLQQALAAGVPALPSYGMTETFGQVATLRPGAAPERKAHPLPGVDMRIDARGRIAVAGPQVSPGYLGEPDRPDRWLVTNDLGEIDADGAVRVLGRADSVIVTGGENVDPVRVESELSGHPHVGDAIVVGVPDVEWGSLVCCVYTGRAEPEELVSWLKARIPAHYVPKRWRRVEALPATSIGKPDRAAAARLVGG